MCCYLITSQSPYIKFLSVAQSICYALLSSHISRYRTWVSLYSYNDVPIRDFHPLDIWHARHTAKGFLPIRIRSLSILWCRRRESDPHALTGIGFWVLAWFSKGKQPAAIRGLEPLNIPMLASLRRIGLWTFRKQEEPFPFLVPPKRVETASGDKFPLFFPVVPGSFAWKPISPGKHEWKQESNLLASRKYFAGFVLKNTVS